MNDYTGKMVLSWASKFSLTVYGVCTQNVPMLKGPRVAQACTTASSASKRTRAGSNELRQRGSELGQREVASGGAP